MTMTMTRFSMLFLTFLTFLTLSRTVTNQRNLVLGLARDTSSLARCLGLREPRDSEERLSVFNRCAVLSEDFKNLATEGCLNRVVSFHHFQNG